MVSLRKIAVAAHASKSAVSLALRDSPKLKPETRRKIKRIARSLGYKRDRVLAASMRRMRTEKDTRTPIQKLADFTKDRPSDPNLCWEWVGYKIYSGYGRLRIGGRLVVAHRVSYEAFVGPIPAGLLVLHKCDNPSCINPDHLFVGTHKDNTQDMIRKGRRVLPTFRKPRAWYSERVATKLTMETARIIFMATGRHADIGRRFGVSRAMVSRIKAGLSWPDARPADASFNGSTLQPLPEAKRAPR